ncbi:MAG: UDP-2,3-diacylglucosamine diphosphatase [Bdellovibrionia bacterium]
MEAWFISDIHLKSDQERNGQVLLRFLHFLKTHSKPGDHLFLLGDIFDLWIGKHQVFYEMYPHIVEALKELKAHGMKLIFVEGNHDVHIDGFFKDKLGMDVFVEAQIYQLNGLNVRVEHGDLINLEDLAYLRYRSFIRQGWMKFLANVLPGRFWKNLGLKASAKSRQHSSQYRAEKESEILGYIRNHAHKIAVENKVDAVVSGHMHVFDDYIVTSNVRELRSFNLGSWLGPEIKVLKLKEQTWSWHSLYPVSDLLD